MKILALGDVVGNGGVEHLCSRLRRFKRENGIDLTVVNGENSAKGNGIDPYSAQALLDAGADVLTTGNHVFRINAFYDYLENERFVVRPLNFPSSAPGRGAVIVDLGMSRVLIMNVMGTVGLEPLGCPFEAVERALEENKGVYDVSVLDIHAEATSEKAAIARYFDGRINVVFGTHTHVQTADARTLPKGTGFITDLGMCGPKQSVLGVKPEQVIARFRTAMPTRFENPAGTQMVCGIALEIDEKTGKAKKIERIYCEIDL